MKKLSDFMLPALAKKGLKKEVVGAHVCFLAEKEARGRFKVISFSRGILKLSVTSSVAAQELSMQEEQLIETLNKELGYKAIKRVRIINGNC